MTWQARRRRRDERGAILPMTAVLIVVVLGFSAFAVDLGLSRAARADMQALSDVVATDLVGEIKGRPASELLASGSAFRLALKNSVDRNATTIGSDPEVDVEVGRVVDGVFQPLTDATVPSAVRVTSATSVDHHFVAGDGTPSRSATALLAQDVACFSVTSTVLTVNTASSPLVQVLQQFLGIDLVSIDASAVGSQGIVDLASASIPLVDFAAAMGVGSPESLVDLDAKPLSEVITVSADLLAAGGHAYASTLLRALGAEVLAEVGHLSVDFGDFMSFGPGTNDAVGVTLDAYDLVTTYIYLAAMEKGAVYVPATTVKIPGEAEFTVKATVIKPPTIACGPVGTTARSAQVDVSLTGTVASNRLTTMNGEYTNVPLGSLTTLLDIIGQLLNTITRGVLTFPEITVSAGVTAGSTTGTLTAVTCDEATGNPAFTVNAVSSSVESWYQVKATLNVKLFNILGLLVKDENRYVTAGVPQSSPVRVNPQAWDPFTFVFAGDAWPSAQSRTQPISTLGLPNLVANDLSGISPNTGLRGQLASSISNIMGNIERTLVGVLNPTLQAAGVGIGQVTVAPLSRPVCGLPRLID